MAKYFNSSWGEIRGKLGEAVGSAYRGIGIVKAYRRHYNHSYDSIEWLSQFTEKEVNKEKIKVAQINVKFVFGLLNYIVHQYYETLIIPIWDLICKNCRYRKLTGANLFIKLNYRYIYKSIPEPDEIYGSENMPDLRGLLLSDGDLEETKITSANYNKESGKLIVRWEPVCYLNGKLDDFVYIAAIYFPPPLLKNWLPESKSWESIRLWGDAINPVAKRGDGEAVIFIGKGLNPKYGVAFLFFKNKTHYSPSESKRFIEM